MQGEWVGGICYLRQFFDECCEDVGRFRGLVRQVNGWVGFVLPEAVL